MKNFFDLLHSTFYILHSRKRGFSLIELVVFVGIFTMTIGAFITILVAVLRVQVRQLAAAEVNGQTQFLLQTVQYYIERSSYIDMTTDSATSTLKLRMASSTQDPTLIYLQSGIAYLREDNDGTPGTPKALTSSRVSVTDLQFIRRANAPGHDAVAIVFSMEYVTSNIQERFSQVLNTGIARVAAATFDSNIVPGSANTYKLGAAAGDWQSVNDTIYFSGSNVGVGVSSPGAKFQVSGGDIYVDTTTRGLIMRSPDGTCWKTTVTNGGALSTATTTCP